MYKSNCLPTYFLQPQETLWKLKSKACHAAFVLIDCGSAVFLGVFRIAKEHAFVSGGFLIFAYTAWLSIVNPLLPRLYKGATDLHLGSSFTCGLDILPQICAGGGRWSL
jgi:hypothetical protein